MAYIEKSEQDKRDFFRIEDGVFLNYRVLAPEEVASTAKRVGAGEGLNQIKLLAELKRLDRQLAPLLEAVKSTSPTISDALNVMNRKIKVLGFLATDLRDDWENRPRDKVNLSGSGLSFNCARELLEGTHLDVDLVLFPEMDSVTAVSRVVRCDKQSKGYRVSLAFLVIDEEDRETIIRHVTRKQMDTIRQTIT